ncbi:hypothetical protein H4Q26_002834, partial [Puccinia striiformis f. sp. tritici PST-130]
LKGMSHPKDPRVTIRGKGSLGFLQTQSNHRFSAQSQEPHAINTSRQQARHSYISYSDQNSAEMLKIHLTKIAWSSARISVILLTWKVIHSHMARLAKELVGRGELYWLPWEPVR